MASVRERALAGARCKVVIPVKFLKCVPMLLIDVFFRCLLVTIAHLPAGVHAQLPVH